MTGIIRELYDFDYIADVLIVGAGACGLCAALSAADAGVETIVLEQTKTPLGTTAMSTGLIPAAGTPEQEQQNIPDTPEIFAQDIKTKNRGMADDQVVDCLAGISAETVAWLQNTHNVPLTLVDGFVYPGHSYRRMYGTPNRTGSELMAALEAAAAASTASIIANAKAVDLYLDADNSVRGVTYQRPDGSLEAIGCKTLVLATCGFAGNAEMVARYIPEMATATLHTHSLNRGDAIVWGQGIGAKLENLDAYQGHAGLAVGHGIPILWPTIMKGGFQVNRLGKRFSNEAKGYSEQAREVLAQPGSVAWTVFDQKIHKVMEQFDDFADAQKAGAVLRAESAAALAKRMNVPSGAFLSTFADVEDAKKGIRGEPFGRDFSGAAALEPPLYAVKVTGAIFHTQGGLAVDRTARIMSRDGSLFPNLFAGGGAARGISGQGAAGYIAGNGLLTATSLGRIAGMSAARQATA